MSAVLPEWMDVLYVKLVNDPAIGPIHISLYFALVHEAGYGFAFPFYIRRHELMRKAKIQSAVTLGQCLRILHTNGYILYKPSYRPGMSCVEMMKISEL